MTVSKIKGWAWGMLGLLSLPVFAIQPVSGWYAGVFLGPTFTPDLDFTWSAPLASKIGASLKPPLTVVPRAGKLKYSVLGGVGGQIGYRLCTKYRMEAELFYNNNPFNELQIGDNVVINSSSSNPNFHIGGDTNTGAVMFNAFYDLITPNNDGYAAIAPYVGLGLGYLYSQNSLQFHFLTDNSVDPPVTTKEVGFTQAHSTYAGQIIAGVSYFMDDFTWLSADIRLFSSGKTTSVNPLTQVNYDNKVALYSIMIGFNGIIGE